MQADRQDKEELEIEIQVEPLPTSGEIKLSVLHIITSVLAAAIGVQSKQNHEKDFSAKTASIFTFFLVSRSPHSLC